MGRENVMKNAHRAPVHWSFWAVGAIALVWNALGSLNFFAQMNPDTVASMPEAYRLVIANRPGWATGAFGVAVFAGTLGCFLLLLRRPVARLFFWASLVGVALTMIHALGLAGSNVDFTPVFVGTAMSLVVAGLLVWYSGWAKRKGWIGSSQG